jgi:hypothetical protein
LKIELFLAADEEWIDKMKMDFHEPINILRAYKMAHEESYATEKHPILSIRRVAYPNRKIQMLFRQHIPTLGVYVYEINLVSYMPDKGCDFTIGIVNHELASQRVHSKDR